MDKLSPRMTFTILEAMNEQGTMDEFYVEMDQLTIKEAHALRVMAEVLMENLPEC